MNERNRLAGTRVLIVEDEALLIMLVEECLEELGCVVAGTATRLAQAMAMAQDIAADMAVLDINLNGELSYPVAELLLARKIPVVFATGYGTSGLPDGLKNAPVLAKPFRMSQLAAALADASLRSAG